MSASYQDEKLVERLVAYTLFKDGRLLVVENVPARVDTETGEQYFAPQTVEHLQRILQENRPPARFVQTPVYEFA